MSIEDAAAIVVLSPSRFAHLFKQQVGLPFRRYKLWRKLARAVLLIGRERTIATAAHAADFADAAHLTRTCYQMFAIPILLAGLVAVFFALDLQAETAGWAGRFGAASSVATLALYGIVQAVDGVALEQAVNAWASAPDAEKAARFASAEAIRWLEWGMRSYQNFTLGLALLLFAAAVVRTAWVPRLLV